MELLCKYGMRMRLLASFKLCLRGHQQMLKGIAKRRKKAALLGFYSQSCWREGSDNCNRKVASLRCFQGRKDKVILVSHTIGILKLR